MTEYRRNDATNAHNDEERAGVIWKTQEELSIVAVDRHDGDQIFVSFSDGTSAIYTAQQLFELAPTRTIEEPQPDG